MTHQTKKHVLWTFAAALLLLASTPLVAQDMQSGSQDTNPQVQEPRTRPAAGNITDDSNLTLNATIKEVRDGQLVIQTPTGIRFVQVTDRTKKPVDLAAGQDVVIDYTRSAQGVMIAQDVRLVSNGTVEESTSAELPATETDSMAEQHAGADADAMDNSLDSDHDADLDADLDNDQDQVAQTDTEQYGSDMESSSSMDSDADAVATSDRDRLPQTASTLPYASLLGMIALAGAFAFRAFRS